MEAHKSHVRQCQGHLAPSDITHSVEDEQIILLFMQRLLLLKGRKIHLGDHNGLISSHGFPSLFSAEWDRPEHESTLI